MSERGKNVIAALYVESGGCTGNIVWDPSIRRDAWNRRVEKGKVVG